MPTKTIALITVWDHLSQLFYPGWLLHAKALQQSVSHVLWGPLNTTLPQRETKFDEAAC